MPPISEDHIFNASTKALLRALEGQSLRPGDSNTFLIFTAQGVCFFASEGAVHALQLQDPSYKSLEFDQFHRRRDDLTTTLERAYVWANHPGFEGLIARRDPFESTCTTPLGEHFYISTEVIRTEDAEVAGLLVLYYPLESLRGSFSPSAYEEVLSALEQGVIVLDQNERLSYVNKKAGELVHGKPEELLLEESHHVSLRTPQGDLLLGGSNPFYKLSDALNLPPMQILLFEFDEYDIRRMMCTFRSFTLPQSEGVYYLIVLEDVTERHHRESQKGELLSIASHELRNPLTPLKGLMQMAVKQAQDTGEVSPALLEKSLDQVNRLARLVDSLLDLSQIETGRMTLTRQPVLLQELLLEVVEVWQMAPDRDGRLIKKEPFESVKLWLDRSAIEQVLTNLLDNAIKFSPVEMPIFVSTELTSKYVKICVENQSDDVTSEVLDLAFDKFYQGTSRKNNTSLGLGLYISRRIVEEHQGSIDMERLHNPARIRIIVSLPRPQEDI